MKLKMISESIVSRIPSFQDLISASQLFEIGKNSVIYPHDNGHITISPSRNGTNLNNNKYQEIINSAMADDNFDIIIDGFREMGFEIGGEMDSQKVGKNADAKFQQQVKQYKQGLPTSGSNEIGGESGLSTGGLGATKRYKTGTPDHVEIEVEHKPEEALEGTDDSFVYHTHPKMANNNWFPGSMNKGLK